jgi:predicted GH43/DUF377 family glycosyl hydrolase
MKFVNPFRLYFKAGAVVLAACCTAPSSPAEPASVSLSNGQAANAPVLMKWSDNTRLGRPFAKDPSVVRFQDRYLLYFSLPPFSPALARADSPRGWSIGIASSADLVKWEKSGEVLPVQDCETNGICAPGAIVLEGKVHLFYQTYGNGAKDAICHAVSDDGVHFRRNPSNPVFHPQGAWTCGRAIDAEVISLEGRLLLYFATRDPAMKVQMLGVAGADLKSDFRRESWKQLSEASILKPELPWERQCIEAPTLCRVDGVLYMFYAGGYNNEPQQIGCAISRDGLKWRRLSHQPFLPSGQPGTWNSSESGHPGVLHVESGRTLLFFQGNNDRGQTWHLAAHELTWRDGAPVLK